MNGRYEETLREINTFIILIMVMVLWVYMSKLIKLCTLHSRVYISVKLFETSFYDN